MGNVPEKTGVLDVDKHGLNAPFPMSLWGQILLQDGGTKLIKSIAWLHDHAIVLVALIIVGVGYFILTLSANRLSCRTMLEGGAWSCLFTIIPFILLFCLAVPSLCILYIIDNPGNPQLTLKALGHQWYWSYEYGDFSDFTIDSYMTPTRSLNIGEYRLLEVDHRACLPLGIDRRIIVRSLDVIHSLAVPSLGLKVDAIPGRLNQITVSPKKAGVFYGRCSEICGVNHAFMPICVEVIPANILYE